MDTLERVLLCLFSPYLMFFLIDNQRGILSYQLRQLHCRARGARAHRLLYHLTLRMESFIHGNVVFFFTLIDRFMCRVNNESLSALDKYVT